MTRQDERRRILEMIEQGKITPAEGAELLRALGTSKGGDGTPTGTGDPRWLRVRVTDMRSGQNKVNVNIPMKIVNAGLNLGGRFIPPGSNLDYEELVQAIRGGEQGKVLDVVHNQDRERIEVFVE